MSASLSGTLNGMDVQTQYEALQKELEARAAQERANATQQAQEALQGYQQMAAQPPPQLSPAETFAPTLLSNIASVLSQNPDYRQKAQEGLRAQSKNLMEARVQNLQSLRDNYIQKAQAAEKAGDATQAEAARLKVEQLSKTAADLLERQREHAAADLAAENRRQEHLNRMAEIAATGAQQRQNATSKAGIGENFNPQSYVDVKTLGSGEQRPYVDLTKVPSTKARQAVSDYARANGIKTIGPTETSAGNLIDSARADIENVTDNVIPMLPSGGGLTRMAQGAVKKGEAFLQTPGEGASLAAYPAIRTAAIKTIQALASLGKGLRINQAEINAAMNFDYPKVTDSQETARKKFKILNSMLDHVEGAAYGRPPTPDQVREVLKELADLRAGRSTPAPAPNRSQAQPSQSDLDYVKSLGLSNGKSK